MRLRCRLSIVLPLLKRTFANERRGISRTPNFLASRRCNRVRSKAPGIGTTGSSNMATVRPRRATVVSSNAKSLSTNAASRPLSKSLPPISSRTQQSFRTTSQPQPPRGHVSDNDQQRSREERITAGDKISDALNHDGRTQTESGSIPKARSFSASRFARCCS